ncbi:MAG: hypothetical protein CMK89_00320 [Pseudomonadales bacterium]|nr:hypothetical protein [Pseudomonadales bacterium]
MDMTLAFGFTWIELLLLGVWLLVALSVTVGIYRMKQNPYRIVLGTGSSKGRWILEHRTDFILGEWEPVFESEIKGEVQQKAYEAYFAHSKFEDFARQRDGELIIDNEVQPVVVAHESKA